MTIIRISLLTAISLLLSCSKKNVLPPTAITPVPTESQLAWHSMELNAFIHFTINTFTDKEWGYGDEKELLFNPSRTDVKQWISTLKDAGFKQVILTCKHHDGFCLWPSKYSTHTIANSPYKGGKGDLVKEVSDMCKEYNLNFGVYLSPWDRNRADYGSSSYITYYRNQLDELFKNYGPVNEMWFDGANGGDGYYGGANESRKINGRDYYDWPNTLNLVRKYQPEIIFFSDAGPGVRWVGNEKGKAGETNWNNISTDTLFAGKADIEKLLESGSELGSSWVPAEVDVSIRPGWFYHAKEDSLVKSGQQLFEIYLTSVGRGSTLLLNVPPDKRGVFHENDVNSLKDFRSILDKEFKTNIGAVDKVTASSYRGNDSKYAASNVSDGNPDSYWATEDDVKTGSIEIDLGQTQTVKYVVLQEYIRLGQRVKAFDIEAWGNDRWVNITSGTTIGYKRILRIEPVKTNKIKVTIKDSRACPVISAVEVY